MSFISFLSKEDSKGTKIPTNSQQNCNMTDKSMKTQRKEQLSICAIRKESGDQFSLVFKNKQV